MASMGDQYRVQLEQLLSYVDESVGLLTNVEHRIDDMISEIVIMGLMNSNTNVAGSLAVAQRARTDFNSLLADFFELRARFNDYRQGLS